MLAIDSEDGVTFVTMDRPAQRNAMSAALVQGLIEAFGALDADPAVRVIVLSGAGKGFCAGSDLGGLAAMAAPGRQHFEAESGRLARQIGGLSKPVIAAVDGFAIGGGMTLATACDLVVSQRAAKWALPEVPIGLFPAWGIASVVDRVGRPAARRLCWGIDTITGEEAYRLGIVDFLADGSALEKAREIAGQLSQLPTMQAGMVKEYFATNPLQGEASDILANRLFMRATLTEAAIASFQKFGSKS